MKHSHPTPLKQKDLDDHHPDHVSDAGHGHSHGVVDPSLFSSERGIWAVKISLAGLLATALFQVVVVAFTGSVALLADTIHNFGDGLTAIPLWLAFRLAKRQPDKRYTYGLGRAEDLAGLAVVLAILISAGLAGFESFRRLAEPQPVRNLWAVIAASLIGFAGNEAVALFRIRIGKEINSAALVADGYHARTDGLTSLAVLAGAIGVALGFPLADPLVGFLITFAILKILWDSAGPVFSRLLDGVDPEVVDEIRALASSAPGVIDVSQVRVRWLGHRLHAEINAAVDHRLSVAQGHAIATQVRHNLQHNLPYLSGVTVHIDPDDASGEDYHGADNHRHDDLEFHSHR